MFGWRLFITAAPIVSTAGVTLTIPIASPIHQVRTSSKYVEASLAPAQTRISTPANAVKSGNTITPITSSQKRLRKSRNDVSIRSQFAQHHGGKRVSAGDDQRVQQDLGDR